MSTLHVGLTVVSQGWWNNCSKWLLSRVLAKYWERLQKDVVGEIVPLFGLP
jgi:hypothetical protein